MHRLVTARRAYLEDAPSRQASVANIEMRFASLSERERQVLLRVVAGETNKQIGRELGIAEVTVKLHRGWVMRKMSAASLVDLVRMWDVLLQLTD